MTMADIDAVMANNNCIGSNNLSYINESLNRLIYANNGLKVSTNWYFAGIILGGKKIALEYIKRIMKTEYKCSISLKNTVKVAKIRPAPMTNKSNNINGIIARNMYNENGAWVTIMTRKTTIIESKKVTKLESVTPNGYMYLGTYNFFNMEAFK